MTRIAISIALCCCINLHADEQADSKETVKGIVTAIAKAFMKQDSETIIKHTHPKVVAMMGGKDQAVALLNKQFAGMLGKVKIQSYKVMNVSLQTINNKEYAIVKTEMIMKVNEQLIKSNGFQLGTQIDDKWVFLDGSGLKNDARKELFIGPDHKQLTLPEITREML